MADVCGDTNQAACSHAAARASARRWAGVRGSCDQSASSPWTALRWSQSAASSASTKRSNTSAIAAPCRRREPAVQIPHVTDPPPRGAAGVVGVVGVAVGAVGIGEAFPPTHDPTEVLERHGGSDGEHRLGHLVELDAAASVGAHAAQLAELGHTQPTRHDR